MRVERRQRADGQSPRITRTATEARQGKIILGPRGRWVWIIAFAVLIVVVIYLTISS